MNVTALRMIQDIEEEYGSISKADSNDKRFIKIKELLSPKDSKRKLVDPYDIYDLTPLKLREKGFVYKVAKMLAAGMTQKAIALELIASISTVNMMIHKYQLNTSYYLVKYKKHEIRKAKMDNVVDELKKLGADIDSKEAFRIMAGFPSKYKIIIKKIYRTRKVVIA